MKILFAVDGSEYTVKAANYLVSHFSWFKDAPELHLLHVRPPIPGGLAVTQAERIVGIEEVAEYYKDEATLALAPAEDIFNKHHIGFQSAYKIGDIAQQVQAYAREHDIDLITMGSHGHGALKNLVLGSAATKILATSSIPVLIVR